MAEFTSRIIGIVRIDLQARCQWFEDADVQISSRFRVAPPAEVVYADNHRLRSELDDLFALASSSHRPEK